MAARSRPLHKPRLLKVGYVCSRQMSRYPRSIKRIPFIRLQGAWLEAAGFAVGRRVTVHVQNGVLVILIVGI